jgi:hypothetical protein
MKWLKIFPTRRRVKANDSVRQRDTWSERLTDRDNDWLNAVNAEDDGILFDAIQFYLKDAIQCLNQASLERTALSCSCAANCLRKIGNTIYANRLYLEAAILYEENAHYMISQSVKGSLWSLQEAYEHYFLAEDFGRAQVIYEEYVSLAAKLNPLFGLRETVQSLEFRKDTAESMQSNNKTFTKSAIQKASMQISLEVTNTIEDFLQLRRKSSTTNNNILKLEKTDLRPTFTAIRSNSVGES